MPTPRNINRAGTPRRSENLLVRMLSSTSAPVTSRMSGVLTMDQGLQDNIQGWTTPIVAA